MKRTSQKSIGYFCVKKSTGAWSSETVAIPVDWESHAKEEERYEYEEDMRLDYVAATRAKNILVISAYRPGGRKKAWQTFYDYIKDVPKLPLSYDTARKDNIFSISKKDWSVVKDKISLDIGKALKESYGSASVTGLVESPELFVGEPAEGVIWGEIVHRSLELCGKGKRDLLEIFARNWLSEHGRPEEDLKRLVKLADDVVKGPLWKRVRQAKEKYFETPFSGLKGKTVIRGVIDLIFREDDGWVVADYKTDDFDKKPERKKAYKAQLDMYADMREGITGEKIKEKILCKV